MVLRLAHHSKHEIARRVAMAVESIVVIDPRPRTVEAHVVRKERLRRQRLKVAALPLCPPNMSPTLAKSIPKIAKRVTPNDRTCV